MVCRAFSSPINACKSFLIYSQAVVSSMPSYIMSAFEQLYALFSNHFCKKINVKKIISLDENITSPILESLLVQALEREARLVDLEAKENPSEAEKVEIQEIKHAKLAYRNNECVRESIHYKNPIVDFSPEKEKAIAIVENYVDLFFYGDPLKVPSSSDIDQLIEWLTHSENRDKELELKTLHQKRLRDSATKAGISADKTVQDIFKAYIVQLNADELLTDLGKGGVTLQSSDAKEYLSRVEDLLTQLEKNSSMLMKPLQLIKLENVAQQLFNVVNKTDPKEKELITRITHLAELSVQQLKPKHKKSLAQMIQNCDSIVLIRNAMHKSYEIYLVPEESNPKLDFALGTESQKAEFIQRKALELRDSLQGLLDKINNDSELSDEELTSIFTQLPKHLKELFYEIIAESYDNNISFKEYFVNRFFTQPESNCLNGLKETREDLKQILIAHASIFFLGSFRLMIDRSKKDLPKVLELIQSFNCNLKLTEVPQKYYLKGLGIIIQKLNNVANRQSARIEKLKNNQPAFVPHYFHATSKLEFALSIASTGIEPTSASCGFGAFVAHQPLLRYGHIAFGLPKWVENSSEISAHVLAEKYDSGERGVWAGLRDTIAINPYFSTIEKNLRTRLETLLDKAIKEFLIKHEGCKEFCQLVKILTLRSISIRAVNSAFNRKVQFCVRYLNPVNCTPSEAIDNINSVSEFFEQIINNLKRIHFPSHEEEILFITLRKKFRKEFNISNEILPTFDVPSTNQINAVIVVPDDDPEVSAYIQKIYYDTVKIGQKARFNSSKEIKDQFYNLGIEENSLEFVPVSEQWLETFLLSKLGQSTPPKALTYSKFT